MRLTNENYNEQASKALDELCSLANINGNDVTKFPVADLMEQQIKLGKLEDIEERMNFNIYQLIDTETFYRRDVWTNEFVKEDFKDWFIDITNRRLVKIKYLVKSFRCNADIISNTFEQISFYDYGKQDKTTDWALTKEELE